MYHPSRLLIGVFILGLWFSGPGPAFAEDAPSADRMKARFRMKESNEENYPMCVAFAPDGKTLATGTFGRDRTARLWDVATGKELRRFDADESAFGVESIAISPDGKTLATGGRNDQVLLWDMGTGKQIREIPSHGGNIVGVAFSPDGKTLAFGGATDNQIHLLDIPNGGEVRVFKADPDRLFCIAMAPDGKSLVSGGANLSLWDLSTGKPIREARQKIWYIGLCP